MNESENRKELEPQDDKVRENLRGRIFITGRHARNAFITLIAGILILIFVEIPQIRLIYIPVLVIVTIIVPLHIFIIKALQDSYTGVSIGRFYGSLAGIIILVVIIAACVIPQFLNTGGRAYENNAKLYLRSLASIQKSFKDEFGYYGTWDELVEHGDIEETTSVSDLIERYKITVFNVNPSSMDSRSVEQSKISTFTIVAFPVQGRDYLFRYPFKINVRENFPGIMITFRDIPGYHLRIFAINERQTPLVWIGPRSKWTTENVSLSNRELWEPLR